MIATVFAHNRDLSDDDTCRSEAEMKRINDYTLAMN